MKFTTSIPRILFIGLLVAASACRPKPPESAWERTVSADPRAEADFREARNLFQQEKFGEADEKFARLIETYPNDPLARVCTVYRARIALEMNNTSRARQLLETLKTETDPVADRAKLYDGVALYREKAFTEAIATLKPLLGKMTDLEENTLLLRTLWQAARDAGQLEEAFIAIDHFLAMEPDEPDRNDAIAALKEMTATMTSIPSLKKLARALPSKDHAWPIVMARIAEIHLEAGHFKESAEILEAIEARKEVEDEDVEGIAEEVARKTSVNMTSVGLLVPLSGRSRLVGETVVKGVMIAADETGLNVVIRDTKGDPVRAAEMVTELVEKENVFAIIGPLDVNVARAAAAKAESLRVPILLLSVGDDVTKTGSFVFRAIPTHLTEINTLLAEAKNAGLTRLGLLYPDNSFGASVHALALKSAQKMSLRVVAESTYDETSTVFRTEAETIAKGKPDALLLLDTPARIPLLAPALAAAGLWSTRSGDVPTGPGEPVQLLIPSFGFSTDLKRRAGRYLNGALFSLFFDPAVTPNAEAFAQKYHVDYGKPPNFLSAFGHDAVVVLGGAANTHAESREDIRTWLVTQSGRFAKTLDTTAPFAGFSGSGDPKARPWIVTLQDGMFQVIGQSEN